MSKYLFLGILATAIILVAFFSCNLVKPKKQITIAYANWAEGIAVTHLAKAILEEQGYEVTLQNADIAPIFASISNQKADVFMDTWLPVTHADYMEQYGNKLEEIGNFVESGLCGTAAVISPVGKITDHGKEIVFRDSEHTMGPVTKQLYDTLTGMQHCEIEAPEGWIHKIM